MRAAPHLLLVEDDESLGFLIKEALISNGWNVTLCTTGTNGFTEFKENTFDICVLDVMLPGMDGFTLAEEIRKHNANLPIMFLTARGRTEDRIKGFQTGADDYVCKPFSIEEFKYRLDAIMKRTTRSLDAPKTDLAFLKLGRSTLDTLTFSLRVNEQTVPLTHKEFKVLHLFFRNPNRIVARDIFLKSIWEDDGFFVARSMDVFVSKVRKYLRSDPHLSIDNIRSVGYILKVNQEPTIVGS